MKCTGVVAAVSAAAVPAFRWVRLQPSSLVVGARDAAHIGEVYEGFCCQRAPAAASL